jgi:hypothetical protein
MLVHLTVKFKYDISKVKINQILTILTHDCFKHAAGQDWRQVLSYDVSLLNIRLVENSVIDLVQFSYNLK